MMPRMHYGNEIVSTHRGALLPERASGAKPLESIGLNAVALVAGTRVSLTLRYFAQNPILGAVQKRTNKLYDN